MEGTRGQARLEFSARGRRRGRPVLPRFTAVREEGLRGRAGGGGGQGRKRRTDPERKGGWIEPPAATQRFFGVLA